MGIYLLMKRAAGVLRLGARGGDDENGAGKRAPQGAFQPPAAVKQDRVGSSFRQFPVHSLHRWNYPIGRLEQSRCHGGMKPGRPVTLRRHLSVALPLSTSGRNYRALAET